MSRDWVLGFIVGLMLVIAVAVAIYKLATRKQGRRQPYDERQQVARGRAFTFAYLTLLIYLAVWFVLRSMEVPFFDQSLSVWLGVLLSLGVFAGYSIFHDAYFRASESPKSWVGMLAAIGIVNLGMGVWRQLSESTLEERLLDNLNLPMGALMVAVLACVLVKRGMDARSEGD